MSAPRRRNTSGGSAPRRRSTGESPSADFWGREPAEEPAPDLIRASDDPTAMVRSLGPPPLPGWERVAEHYFEAVYEKAANLAIALAAASGLLATE
jgi:hypothetical protein